MNLNNHSSNHVARLTLYSVKHLYTDVYLALTAGFLFVFFSALLFPSANPLFFLTAPVDNTSAACVPAIGDSCGDYTSALTLATSGRADFPLLASESGRISSSTLTTWVATDNPVGYSLSISAAAMNGGTDGNLTNKNNAITGRTDALIPITDPNTSSPATIESPATFSSANCNAWGFALAKPQATGIANGWNDTYSTQTNLLTTDSTHNIYKYAAVPAASDPALVIKNTSASSTNESTIIYLAACAGGTGGALSEGVYQGNIVLSAIVNALPAPTITSVSPNSGPITGNTLITLTGNNFGSAANPYLTEAYIGGTEANNWTDGYPCTGLTIVSNTQATCRTAGEDNPDTPIQDQDGTALQVITTDTCPTTRIRAYDARDNHSYYVQKLADGKCWMLTNLAYAGDGNTTYGDTTTLPAATTSGYFGGSSANAYTTKEWADASPSGIGSASSAPVTTEPTNPSTTTGSGGQYGYLYNWCAAMGGQVTACSSTSTQPDQGVNAGSGANNNLNICPKGWRLPTGGRGGEFQALNSAVSSGSTPKDSGLRSTWLGVYSGNYLNDLHDQDYIGLYWSSTVYDATSAHDLIFHPSVVAFDSYSGEFSGRAVRCMADTESVPSVVAIPAPQAGTYAATAKGASGWYSKGGAFEYERVIPSVGVMQNITDATCPTELSRAYDARDNHSYYVQKLADGKCWMLTNLAYAGDGNTAYGDTTTLPAATTSGYFGGSFDNAYLDKYWAEPGGTMYTTEPTNPSTTAGANGQYGYLYNWCAAMGGQAAACQSYSATTQPDQGANAGAGANNNLNICPKGWRLPTGGSGSEIVALNDAVNGGATNTDAGLRNAWLGVYSGYHNNGLGYQGSDGRYWSSTVNYTYVYYMGFASGGVNPEYYFERSYGLAVRCIAP